MGLIAKAKSSSGSENWGMGMLLVFFPEDNSSTMTTTTTTAAAIVDKTNKLFSSATSSPPSSSSSCSSKTCTPTSTTSSFKRSNSNNLLLSKAQSTISICALLVFITLLLFTLSTFEPTTKPNPIITTATATSRRFLSQKPPPKLLSAPTNANTNPNHNFLHSNNSSWFAKMWKQKQTNPKNISHHPRRQFALQKVGTLFRRGSRAMSDLVVGHFPDDVTDDEVRMFLRLLHRSGLTSKADVAFIFSSSASRFESVIAEEDESFFKLIRHYKGLNWTGKEPDSGFNVNQFLKAGKKEIEEPLWGKKSGNSEGDAELTQLSYGSVVGFEAGELDPENSLSGFLDHVVPMSLRRWACYPMLLGRVRRNFKHILLVDVKNLVVLGDPLGRVRRKSPESVLLFTMSAGGNKHGKKNSDQTQSHGLVNSVIITGGARGIRRLSNTVLTEIVRATMQHKRKSSVTESRILSQLVSNTFVSKHITLVTSNEPVPEPGALAAGTGLSGFSIIQRGNSNPHDLNSIIMKQICLSEIDSSVYRDCLRKQ